jgi:hypothetical protein
MRRQDVGLARKRRLAVAVAAIALAAAGGVPAVAGAAGQRVGANAAPPSLTKLKSEIKAGVSLNTFPSDLGNQLEGEAFAFYSGKCVESTTSSTSIPTDCRFGDVTSKTVVVLDGDSFAGMWFPALEWLATQDKFDLVLVARLDCPFALVPVSSACSTWQQNAVTFINGLKPKAIIATSENIYPLKPSEPQVTQAQFATGITNALHQFTTPSVEKLVLVGMPAVAFGSPAVAVEPNACISGNLHTLKKCDVSTSVGILASRVAADTGATKAAGGHAVSLTSLFCTSTTCPVVVDGKLVYADPFHVNTSYANLVKGALGQLLKSYKL